MTKKILVPVDGSAQSNRAINFASRIARQEKAAIHLIYVLQGTNIPEAIMGYVKSENKKESADAIYLELVRDKILNKAQEVVNEHGISNVITQLIIGQPTEKILDYASYNDVDIIVVATRRFGSGRKQQGSVAIKVANLAHTTCIIIRKKLLDDKKLLIVDDEPDVLATLKELLPMCEIEEASSFERAKSLLKTKDFDLAILDIMGVEGYKLLEIANQKNVTSIILTGHALTPKDTMYSFKKGAASYVPKEKMWEIATYLNDILEAKEKGNPIWGRWLDRFGSFFDEKFGPAWHKTNEEFLRDILR